MIIDLIIFLIKILKFKWVKPFTKWLICFLFHSKEYREHSSYIYYGCRQQEKCTKCGCINIKYLFLEKIKSIPRELKFIFNNYRY